MASNITFMQTPADNFYKHVMVDVPPVYMKQIVGKKGKHLKQCCVDFGVNNIWFNMNRHILEIWGPKMNIDKAADHFMKKIDTVRMNIPISELKTHLDLVKREEDMHVSGSVDGVITKDQLKLLIGKNGRHFKRITRDSGVSFIWYNDENNSIDIWGPKDNLSSCIEKLSSWMTKVQKMNSVSMSDKKNINDVEMID